MPSVNALQPGEQVRFTLTELPDVAARIAALWPAHTVFGFTGELGAGKTTLVQHLLRAWGSSDLAQSPTFGLVNEYACPGGSVYHLDLYRLRTLDEAFEAGLHTVLHSGNRCLVEWPDALPELLPDATVHFTLEAIADSAADLRELKRLP